MLLSGTTRFASLPVRMRVPDAPLAPYSGAACWAALAGAATPPVLRAAPPPEPLELEAEHAVTARPAPTRAAPAMMRVRNDPWRARAPEARNVRVMHLGR